MGKISYIDEILIQDQKVLLRVDYNVSFLANREIADDFRIKQSLATINYLLEKNNRVVLMSHLGNPKGYEPDLSLKRIMPLLTRCFPSYEVVLLNPLLDADDQIGLQNQTDKQIILLENLRFNSGEKNSDPVYCRELAALGQIYVNDAFAVCHRKDASVTSLPHLLPGFGGLLLKKEISAVNKLLENIERPFVAVVGGAKISTKIQFIEKLLTLADKVLVGGAMANTFLKAAGADIGESLYEEQELETAKKLLTIQNSSDIFLDKAAFDAAHTNIDQSRLTRPTNKLLLPTDFVKQDNKILDIGPETQKLFSHEIGAAKTILWNGPMGYTEDPSFSVGTEKICQAITNNQPAFSVVGGGDTLAAIAHLPNIKNIDHISTGGGALLEYVANNGLLPGTEALKK